MRYRLALLALGAIVAGPAQAFVRSTTAVDGGGVSHPDQGFCTWWNTRAIHYLVNASVLDDAALSGCGSAAAASALVQASFATWSGATRSGEQQACTDMQFVHDRDDSTATELGYDESASGSNTNLVVWRKGACSDFPDADCHGPLADMGPCIARHNCWAYADAGILALTHTTFRPSTGEILDADMELHAWDGVSAEEAGGWWYTCAPPGSGTCTSPYGQDGCVYIDVGNTVTHEAGHVLGLDHTCAYAPPYHDVCGSVMDGSATRGETSKRTLKEDDVDAVCTIYPAGSSVDRVTHCPNAPEEQGSGCGCSTASPGALAPFGLLALALGLGRRRPRLRAPAGQRTIAPA